ncbi:MAG: nucleotidyltransferase family protein, partial [Desulfobacterales bacterium]
MPEWENFIQKDQLPAYRLLIRLSRADLKGDEKGEIISFLKTTPIDWGVVFNLCGTHRVLPVLYHNIRQLALQPYLPAFVREKLSQRYLRVIGNNLRLQKQLLSVLALFESRDIPAVPFKGPVLAQILYGDSALRYCQDLDVLVPKVCVAAARDALLQSDYAPYIKGISDKQFQQIIKYGREIEFLDPSGKVCLDLHWELSPAFGRVYDYDFCKDRLRVMRLDGRAVYSLSAEDTLLHLCMNGAYDLWANLDKILCVADFLVTHPEIDWDLVQTLARALRCRKALLLGLFLARDVFDAAVPRELADQIEKNTEIQKLAESIYGQLFKDTRHNSYIEKRMGQLPFYLKMRENMFDKSVYLLRRIFVPT